MKAIPLIYAHRHQRIPRLRDARWWPDFNDDLAVTPDGKTVLFTRMSISAPIEIYASTLAGEGCPALDRKRRCGKRELQSQQRLGGCTHVNDSLLSQISMAPVESFWFKGAHGDEVEGFMVKPPNFDARRNIP